MKIIMTLWRARLVILATIGLCALAEFRAEILLGISTRPALIMRALHMPLDYVGAGWFVATLLLLTSHSHSADADNRRNGHAFAAMILGLALVVWVAIDLITGASSVLLPVQYWIAGACVVVMFWTAAQLPSASFPELLRNARRDFAALVSSPRVIAAGVIVGTAFYLLSRPETDALIQMRSFQRWYLDQQRMVAPTVDLVGDAPIRVIAFVDYECPFSRLAAAEMLPVLADYQRRYPAHISIQLRDFPLDTECNDMYRPRPGTNLHPVACEAAAAVRVAKERGAEGLITEWLWTNQGLLSRDAVFKEVQDTVGVDLEARYSRVLEAIAVDTAAGGALGVTRTPTFWLNGVLLGYTSGINLRWALSHELSAAGVTAD